ncbi:MAG: large repetitive protein [Frankiaceae bacterium]|jgi:uncharacterized repeat protein (TIGR01451 family)|nr:large repetitive protein [Frankiaceae bacterium]
MTRRRWAPVLSRAAAAAVVLIAGQVGSAGAAAAAEIPPTGSPFFFQTNGPGAALGNGDWYASAAPGAGAGYHYVQFAVPCGWPTTTPVTVDLFSPEMNADAAALTTHDEGAGSLDTTTFELYGPGTPVGPGFDQPAPGTGTLLTSYPPSATGVAEAWVRFATLSPVTCGTYVVRSATATDDQNGWRIRVGFDADSNVATAPVDDLDGVPGTNDELVVGQSAVSYQQNSGANACIDLYEFVGPGQATMNIHNFDYDLTAIPGSAVNYVSPSGTVTAGTVSAPSATWNVSNAVSRGAGDVITNPEAGWWRISSCVSSGNQFIQEGQFNVPAFSARPPAPALDVTKSDGEAVAASGDTLTYTVGITNTGDPVLPGAATAVVATDTLPAGTTFISCGFVAPATGTCGASAGVVTATLTGAMNAGASATLAVTVTVDTGATGPLTNDVSVAYQDSFGNSFTPAVATDVDVVGTGAIGNLVFYDADGDGTQDAGEPGFPAVPVRLVWAGADDTFSTADDEITDTTTDANGGYLFTGLAAGQYQVDPVGPAGFVLTAGTDPFPVTLGAGQQDLTADFGYTGTASIGDRVWNDLDGDGVQDGGEPGIAGVTVTATWAGFDGTAGTPDDRAFTGTTNGSGVYAIPGLPPGAYAVAVTGGLPPGYVATTAATIATTLTPGEAETGADFGYQQQADLVVTKTTSTPTVSAGDDASWTVTVSNAGPAAAAGPITVTDTLPAGTTYVSAGGTGWTCGEAAGTVTCTRAGALANASALPPITVVATVTADAASTVTNPASVTSATFDPDLSNNTATSDVTAVPSADVTITKSHAGAFLVGSDAAYTILVGNDGPSAAAGPFTVTDTLPPGLTFVSAAGTGWTCTGSATVSCAHAGPLAAGSSLPAITLTVAVTTAAEGGVTNTAAVDPGATADPDPSNNTSADPTTVVPVADLGIVKAATGTFVVGQQAGYTLTVSNAGPSTAAGPIVVTDTLPTGLTFVSGTGTGWACAATGQDVTCTHAGSLATGPDSVVTVTVDVGATVGSVVDNTAAVDGPTLDPNPANDTSTASDPATPTVDLAIGKSHTGTFLVGGTASYTITVANNGPSAATGTVTVHDPLPAGLTPTGASGTGWTCGIVAQAVTCTRAGGVGIGVTLPPITVTATVGAAAYPSVTNVTTVDTPAGTNEPVTSNNTASDPATVEPRADLTVTKTHAGSFGVGTNGTYTLTVGNEGPTEATGPITVVDTLPAGLGFVSAGGGGFTCTAAAQTVTCTRAAALANGASVTITLVVSVGPAAAGTAVNHVEVSGPATDPDPTDNADDDPTLVVPSVDLAVTKSHTGAFRVGERGTYLLTVTNHGPSAAAAVTLTDALPAGFTYVSGTGTGWVCGAVARTVTCTFTGPLAAGASSAITLVVAVGPTAAATSVNVADVASPAPDLNPADNHATDSTQVVPDVDLRLRKTIVGPAVVGADATWHLVVSNAGLSAAPGPVTMVDTLPAGLTFTAASGPGWACSAAGQVVTCVHAGPLAAGAVSTITVVTRVVTGGRLTNPATVVSSAADRNPADNSDTLIVSAVAAPVPALPATGGDPVPLTAFGLALLTLGAAALTLARRAAISPLEEPCCAYSLSPPASPSRPSPRPRPRRPVWP